MNQDESEYVRREVEKARRGQIYGTTVVKCPITPGCVEDVCRYDGDGTNDRYGIYCPMCGAFQVWKKSSTNYKIMSLFPLFTELEK